MDADEVPELLLLAGVRRCPLRGMCGMSSLGNLFGANPILVLITCAIVAGAAWTAWSEWTAAASEAERADRDDFYDWDDQR